MQSVKKSEKIKDSNDLMEIATERDKRFYKTAY